MPGSIIVRPAFCHLGIIISFEGGVILYNIVSYIDECVPEHSGAALGINYWGGKQKRLNW